MRSHHDIVVPFVFESLPVRGALIQLQHAWRRMQLGHHYERPVLETLGHSAAASALIAQSLKFDGSITLQITGDGPLSMLVMQCTSKLELRGMANAAPLAEAAAFPELVSRARCAITVDAGTLEQPYQGIVEVGGESLADSLELYYARSAQIPTHLALVSDPFCCGGLLLQRMPGEDAVPTDDWYRLGLLAATLRVVDVNGGIGPGLLARLFGEDDLRLFDPRPAMFRCRCTRQRTEAVLRLLGEAETRSVLAERGRVEVTCEYCGRRRHFDAVDVDGLFVETVSPPSDTLH